MSPACLLMEVLLLAVIERDIVLMSRDADGNQTIDLPITNLGNIEGTADVKSVPEIGDHVPVLDHADGGQMKKTTVEALAGYVAEATGLNAHTADTSKHVTDAERGKWNGKQDKLTFDTAPKSGSSNPVTSGGVKSALDGKANTSHGTHVTYSTAAPVMDGTAAVGSAAACARADHRHPTDTSRAAASDLSAHAGNTTAHVTDAERKKWNAKQDALTFDSAPTAGSENPVTSGAVYQAIQEVTMPIWYVTRKPVSITIPKGNWNGTSCVLTIPDGYRMVDEHVQVGIPSQSSEANTEQLLKSAIVAVDNGASIMLSAITVPTTDVTIAVFGLEEKPVATENTESTTGGTTA